MKTKVYQGNRRRRWCNEKDNTASHVLLKWTGSTQTWRPEEILQGSSQGSFVRWLCSQAKLQRIERRASLTLHCRDPSGKEIIQVFRVLRNSSSGKTRAAYEVCGCKLYRWMFWKFLYCNMLLKAVRQELVLLCTDMENIFYIQKWDHELHYSTEEAL